MANNKVDESLFEDVEYNEELFEDVPYESSTSEQDLPV